MGSDTQSLPNPAQEGPFVAPDGSSVPPPAQEPLLPPGTWTVWPGTERPRMVRPDRPQPLWRPGDGTVAVPALKTGVWVYVLVSRQDTPWVLTMNWYVSKAGYAVCNQMVDGRKVKPYLHRLVKAREDDLDLANVSPLVLVDHRNLRPLDCRRRNLRWSDSSLNQQNIGKEHPGVTWHEYKHRWQARITWQGKDIHVCYSRSKNAAIRLRAERARELGIPMHGAAVG